MSSILFDPACRRCPRLAEFREESGHATLATMRLLFRLSGTPILAG